MWLLTLGMAGLVVPSFVVSALDYLMWTMPGGDVLFAYRLVLFVNVASMILLVIGLAAVLHDVRWRLKSQRQE